MATQTICIHVVVWLLVAALYSATAENLAPSKPKHIIVIFGDSITDNGNTLLTGGVPDPNIYTDSKGVIKGRYTNGYNWVDYLNATISAKYPVQIFNYAYGGATACPDALEAKLLPFIKDLAAQTQLFLADVKAGKIVVDPSTRLLVVQWIGSNDYLLALDDVVKGGTVPTEADVAELISNTTACRMAQLRSLAALSGVVTDILLMPLSPLHVTTQLPAVFKNEVWRLERIAGAATVAAAKALQKAFDAAPPGTPGAGMRVFTLGDNADWIARLVPRVQPPFKYLDVSCFDNPNSAVFVTPGLIPCTNPDDYFLFDNSHPTTRFHQLFVSKGLLPRLQNLRLLPDDL